MQKVKELRQIRGGKMTKNLPQGNEVDPGQRCPQDNKLICEREVTLALGQLLPRGSSCKQGLTSARPVTRCCTRVTRLEVAPEQPKTHVNSNIHQTAYQGKVYHGVTDLQLPWVYVNSSLHLYHFQNGSLGIQA